MTQAPERTAEAGEQPAATAAEETPQTTRYTMWSVFAAQGQLGEDRGAVAHEVQDVVADLADRGLEVRGWYDVSGLRADADVMVWWHAPSVELVQEAYRRLRRTRLGRALAPVWSSVGVHRRAEFNARHVPAFLAGEEPRAYLNVYPFTRSYEWYLLPEDERRTMLRDHGLAAMPYPDVRANTVSAFALGDYEWLLAFEADELHRIVDLMRDLRATEARRHVRAELPFFTGRRVPLTGLVELLP